MASAGVQSRESSRLNMASRIDHERRETGRMSEEDQERKTKRTEKGGQKRECKRMEDQMA